MLLIRGLVAACALTVLVTGCAAAGERPSAGGGGSSSDPSPSQPETTPRENFDPGPLVVPDVDPPPCRKIRAGIDAFNAGDLEATVARFEEALPIARREAAKHPTRNNRLLLEAVEYYAKLPPADYPEAITSSPAFKRQQVVTLGLCRYGQAPSAPSQSPSGGGRAT